MISRISEWSQKRYTVSISPIRLAREIRLSEIPKEIKDVLHAIECGEAFQ